MPYPRSALVSLDATPWYHVISRRVRRWNSGNEFGDEFRRIQRNLKGNLKWTLTQCDTKSHAYLSWS